MTRHSTWRHIPKISKNMCPHKNLHRNVPNSIVSNSQEVETTDKWI